MLSWTPTDFVSTVAAGLGAAVLCYAALTATRNGKYAGVNLPPGDLGWPFIGNALEFMNNKKFGDNRPTLSSFRFFDVRAVLVRDAKMAEMLVQSEGRLIEPNHGHLRGVASAFGEQAVISMQGRRHKKIRGQLLRAFSRKVLDHIFYEHQKILRDRVNRWVERGTFDGSTDTRDVAADVGCATIGIDSFSNARESQQVMRLIDRVLEGILAVPINIPGIPTKCRLGRLARIEIFENFIRPIIKDRRERPRTGEEGERDLPTIVINAKDENGAPFSEELIEANLLLMVIGALDTSWTSFMYFVRVMCKYPEVQEKIRAEMRAVLGDRYRSGEGFPPELLNEMVYLDQVLHEVMRMHPVVAGLVFRKAKVDFQLGGYTIPKGMKIRLSTWHTANDPTVWTNPEKFDPSRFAPGGEGIEHSSSLLSFGFGTRQCIGKYLAERVRKLFAIFLLRDHRLEFANGEEPELSTYSPFQRVLKEFPVKLVQVHVP